MSTITDSPSLNNSSLPNGYAAVFTAADLERLGRGGPDSPRFEFDRGYEAARDDAPRGVAREVSWTPLPGSNRDYGFIGNRAGWEAHRLGDPVGASDLAWDRWFGPAVEAAAPAEREADDDETLFAGQNYGWLAANGESAALPQPVVEIDGRAWQVTASECVESLRRLSPRMADYWARRGIVATVAQSPFPIKTTTPGDDLVWGDDFKRLLAEQQQRRLEEAWPVSSWPTVAEEPAAEPETNATADEVEIDGRAYQVTDRLSIEQLPARVASVWRREGVVARVEVRRPRGRGSYVARQYADGSFSRPWRGSLVAAN